MKVKCINKGIWLSLTIGKTYDVIEYDYDGYYKMDNEKWYPKSWFKSLSEIRNEKIDKLLR
jgi:hypothetical protein